MKNYFEITNNAKKAAMRTYIEFIWNEFINSHGKLSDDEQKFLYMNYQSSIKEYEAIFDEKYTAV